MKTQLTLLLVSLALSTATAQDRPNILWISAEDLSPRLGAYGDPVAQTPNLDRLAKEGIRYTQGHLPEDRMVRAMWMGTEQPITSPPVFAVRSGTDLEFNSVLVGPVEIVIESGTHGASISFTTDGGRDTHWRLYSSPLRIYKSDVTLRARAVRYGYRESEEAEVRLHVRQH